MKIDKYLQNTLVIETKYEFRVKVLKRPSVMSHCVHCVFKKMNRPN